ncbi:MAG: amylo-alpha-1,6-glucosidase, partial [Planctomycetota bacterium]
RDFHSMRQRDTAGPWHLGGEHDALWVQLQDNHEVTLALLATAGEVSWQTNPDWWFNFRYRVEWRRGFSENEDLLNAGTFRAENSGNFSCELAAVGFVGSVAAARDVLNGPAGVPAAAVGESSSDDPVARRLEAAASQFVVWREPHEGREPLATVLAGYPWFGDWGRDSFIALEGLLLIPGRFDEARQVLATFAGAQRNGLIANCFDDYGDGCAYNSVDASLWFVHAADAYLRYSSDTTSWAAFLMGACRNVVRSFSDGTDYGIHVDERGLVCCGNETTQITWMDAKNGDVVFTPRHGLPVEVNALWYHAVHVVAERAQAADPALAQHCRDLIRAIDAAFVELFWNEATGCLFDCVRDDFRDPAVRPNQILTVSLPHSPLPAAHRRKVWEVVTEQLLTPMGLRSLSRDHRRYFASYDGGPFERDHAYHNGTVWSWLIGPYVEAHLRVHGFSQQAKRYGRRLLQPLIEHMSEAGLGSISEIFDAEAPHTPRGCIAQAWSIAEVLRAWKLTEPDAQRDDVANHVATSAARS